MTERASEFVLASAAFVAAVGRHWIVDLGFTALSGTASHVPDIPPATLSVTDASGRRLAAINPVSVQRRQPAGEVQRAVFTIAATARGAPSVGATGLLVQIADCPGIGGGAATTPLAWRTAQPADDPVQGAPAGADISYLRRDYDGLRQMMLDTLHALQPDWVADGPADPGVMLVEALAYAADYTSYDQDSVLAEAYLPTARQTRSLHRHARLLGYEAGMGSNCRAMISLVVRRRLDLPRHTLTVAGTTSAPVLAQTSREAQDLIRGGAPVFRTLEATTCLPSLNKLAFKTWGMPGATLPLGACSADIRDAWTSGGDQTRTRYLEHLVPGMLIVLIADETREGAAADPSMRQAIRLTDVIRRVTTDSAGKAVPWITLRWREKDALGFELPLSRRDEDGNLRDTAHIQANVVLADHGLPRVLRQRRYTGAPVPIEVDDIAWLSAFDAKAVNDGPAATALAIDTTTSLPAIVLHENNAPDPSSRPGSGPRKGARWHPVRDLLGSTPHSRAFVPERLPTGGFALRFGDGDLGSRPKYGTTFDVHIRTGPPQTVGYGSISALVTPDEAQRVRYEQSVVSVTNPVSSGPIALPERPETIRRRAPHSTSVSKVCANAADARALALAAPGIADATVRLADGGTWPVFDVVIRMDSDVPPPDDMLNALAQTIRERLVAGRHAHVRPARHVPLTISLAIQLSPDAYPQPVADALRHSFSDVVTTSGPPAFFAPGVRPLGAAVYASDVLHRAQQVPGVADAQLLAFGRTAISGAPTPDSVTMAWDEYPVLGHFRTTLDAETTMMPFLNLITPDSQAGGRL